jgi:20S proteasome subunit beta 4
VTVLNQTDDKSRSLNRHNLLIFAGESGDTIQFAEYVQANVQLYGMKNDTELNSDAVAAFTRREMADNLRTRVPFPVLWKHVFCVRLLLFRAVFLAGGLGAG